MSEPLKHKVYQELIIGDLEWLCKQPASLERDHIAIVLKESIRLLYPKEIIKLVCDQCGVATDVKRDPRVDPPEAVTCLMSACYDCAKNGEFEQIHYYNKNGLEISGDSEEWSK